MQKKLTITLDPAVYEGLHRVVGRRRISKFIETLVRPHVTRQRLEEAYREQAADAAAEAEARAWVEGLIGDLAHETR